MLKVNVYKQSNYPINPKKLKIFLGELFFSKGVVSDAEVSVAIVGENKMLALAKKYLKEHGRLAHNVLSFTPEETGKAFAYPPDGLVHLGEIVICFPKVVEEAKKEGVLIETKALELIKHGALHLLGIHHE
jgi:probable rRNA maturation factor